MLEKKTGYHCLKYLYIVMNYINDNFPVMPIGEMNFEEEKLVKFLLYSGDEQKLYGFLKDDFDKLVKGICEKYKCDNLNTALNLILIEKYLNGENKTFIKVIDVLK